MLENLPPHKHEYWVMEGMLPLGGGEIRRKVALLPKMECDAIIRMELPDIFWADLAGWIAWHPKGTSSQASLLRARDIVVEHFSDSMGGWKFHTCSAKRSTYARDYYRPGMRDLPRREPCLVTFTHALPMKIIKSGVYQSFGVPGIYFRGTEELALELLVVASRLPKDTKYNWLRRCGRAPEPSEEHKVVNELREMRELSTIEEERVMEAAMTIEAYSHMTIKELAKETVRLRRALVETELELKEKDQVLYQVLQEKDQVLQEKDQVLQEKDQVLQEKDQVLQEKDAELQRLRDLLKE